MINLMMDQMVKLDDKPNDRPDNKPDDKPNDGLDNKYDKYDIIDFWKRNIQMIG